MRVCVEKFYHWCSGLHNESSLSVLALLALVNLVGNYSLSSQFGIYEDDYILTIPSTGLAFSDLLKEVTQYLFTWPQGRPFFWVIHSFSAWLAFATGGIHHFYLFSFFLTIAAAFCVYLLLRRFFAVWICLVVAAFFVLFPADTSKQIFMHQVPFSVGTILTVAALTSFLDERWLRAAMFGVIILLTYEAYFLVLPCVVFIKLAKHPAQPTKQIVAWAGILASILIGVLLIRRLLGESRATSLLEDPSQALLNSAQALVIGPITLFLLFFIRPLEGILFGNWFQWTAALCVASVLVIGIGYLGKKQSTEGGVYGKLPAAGWFLLGAYLALGLPYGYRFIPDYFPPVVNIGRLSALHQVSALGSCLLLGWGLQWISVRFKSSLKGVVLVAIAVPALQIPFALEIQETQYLRNARQQQDFWRDLLGQIGDWKPGMPIIVDLGSGLGPDHDDRPSTEGFSALWLTNYPIKMIPYLVKMPDEWPHTWPEAPQIYAYFGKATQWTQGDSLALVSAFITTKDDPVLLSSGNFLLFRWKAGRLRSVTDALEVQNLALLPKRPESGFDQMPPLTPLGRDLLAPSRAMWPSLIPPRPYP